ncbi:acyltransferase [Flavobacterium sp. SUN052]|uniref:acyltransferase family protein n=1 Tax=Flavobacterium sp. SUN052 TaxID=3002441 RepID=UPI00237E82A9|nr:acyltransferase [Flavobacterium sp. SUN052]MEC4005495.1 acyltransferase [Flavobacterium sp. SUN052]
MIEGSKSNYLNILQIFRGIAALMIVFHHTIGSIKFYHKIDFPFFNLLGLFSKYGVDFFFILSGFIISYATYYKYKEPNSFTKYIKNRLIRIYIPYLPIGISILVLYSILPNFSNATRNISTLTSITLIPDGSPALSVAWSLSYELCFYFLFSLSFISKKIWYIFLIVWFSAILAVNYYFTEIFKLFNNPFLTVLLSAYNIEFIFGFFLAMIILKKIKLNLKLMLSLLFIATASSFYCILTNYSLFYFSNNLLFIFISFIIIYLAITYDNKRIKKTALFMLIGNASYSIYLIHNPLQMLLVRFMPKINSCFGVAFVSIFVMIIACLYGYLYYLIFEKIVLQRIKKMFL